MKYLTVCLFLFAISCTAGTTTTGGGSDGDTDSDTDTDTDADTDSDGDTDTESDTDMCCDEDNPCDWDENETCDCDDDYAGSWDVVDCLPKTATVELIGAVIGPGTADGDTWDGLGTLPDGLAGDLTDLLYGTATPGDILEFIGNTGINYLEKPDVYGDANMNLGEGDGFNNPLTLLTEDEAVEDSFLPNWSDDAVYYDVPIHHADDLQIRVELLDDDYWPDTDDFVGEAVINNQDIIDAFISEEIWWVQVADQTVNQVLMLSILVY